MSKQLTFPADAAFTRSANESGYGWEDGLTKREYFAAATLNALIGRGLGYSGEKLAELAVEYADELINALNK